MRYNVTEWALRHQAFTGFLMVLLVLGGAFAFFNLGQKEDPEFTFRVMVVKTLYPGASAVEVERQVTDRLEKKLQELPYLDNLRSYSKPGESVIFITPRQDVPPREIAYTLYIARKKVADMRHTLPHRAARRSWRNLGSCIEAQRLGFQGARPSAGAARPGRSTGLQDALQR